MIRNMIRYLATPSDFSGQPYVGGLNQMGHVVAGAAVAGALSTVVFPYAALLIGGLLIIAWEGWQLHAQDAGRRDYVADLFYWLSGAVGWTLVVMSHPSVALAPLLPCAAFVLEYLRIARRA